MSVAEGILQLVNRLTAATGELQSEIERHKETKQELSAAQAELDMTSKHLLVLQDRLLLQGEKLSGSTRDDWRSSLAYGRTVQPLTYKLGEALLGEPVIESVAEEYGL